MGKDKYKSDEYSLGFKIGEAFAIVLAICIMAIITALTAGCIIIFFRWLL